MKRLFYLVIIITLPIIVFFQFWNYRKFNPPTDYAYTVSQKIDPNYHDPEMVMRYYMTSKEVGNYARYIWKEHRIDVKFADSTDPEEKEFSQIYKSLVASAQFLEGKLEKSLEWKGKGKTNEDIVLLEQGIEQKPMKAQVSPDPQANTKVNPILAQIGDNNATVREIQLTLVDKGFDIAVDGIFREETKTAVEAFQKKKKLSETGIVDIDTFIKLMK